MAEAEVPQWPGCSGKRTVLDPIAKPDICGSDRCHLRTGCCNEGPGIASRSDLDGGELFDDLCPFRPLAGLLVDRHGAWLDIGVEDLRGFGHLLVEDVQTDGFVWVPTWTQCRHSTGRIADPSPAKRARLTCSSDLA